MSLCVCVYVRRWKSYLTSPIKQFRVNAIIKKNEDDDDDDDDTIDTQQQHIKMLINLLVVNE